MLDQRLYECYRIQTHVYGLVSLSNFGEVAGFSPLKDILNIPNIWISSEARQRARFAAAVADY